jgi:hypothetical protein
VHHLVTISISMQVIDYIQALQEKVRKFESAEQARHQERLKSMVWDLCKVRMIVRQRFFRAMFSIGVQFSFRM